MQRTWQETRSIKIKGSSHLSQAFVQGFPLTVKPGDRVLFSGYSGEEIKIDGQEVLLIREDDILAVIHD